MTWWHRVWNRRHVENQLDAELRDHFDRLVSDNIARGMSRTEATRHARLEFGGSDQIKEECRDARGTRWIDDSTHDLRFAMRITTRDPWFTAAIVVSLALGIGVCSMAFTITDAYFFRGLPVSDSARMVYVGTIDAGGRDHGVSFADYRDWQAALPDVDMSAFKTGQMSVGEKGRAADRISGAFVSGEIFRLLSVHASAGRVFGPEDERGDGTRGGAGWPPPLAATL